MTRSTALAGIRPMVLAIGFGRSFGDQWAIRDLDLELAPVRIWTLVFGLFVLGIGIWSFLGRTLGIDLPTIRWRQLWPVILIVIGALVLLGALRRERH